MGAFDLSAAPAEVARAFKNDRKQIEAGLIRDEVPVFGLLQRNRAPIGHESEAVGGVS